MNNHKVIQQPKKYKRGYVPGVFDLFHIGHLNLIRRAKEQSEYLLAGVLTDELVVHFKGKKPCIPFEERIAIVAALRDVDQVVKVDFSNTIKMDAWKMYHYDAYFSGDDHGSEWDEERKALQSVGSDIVFLSYTQGTSSTWIRQELQEQKRKERLYLFGAGRIGQRTIRQMRLECRDEEWEIAGFLDNQREKRLTRVDGLPVYGPEDLRTLEREDSFTVAVTMKDKEAAYKQLTSLGLEGQLRLVDAQNL